MALSTAAGWCSLDIERTSRHQIIAQVTEDPELAQALRSAAAHLPPGLSRSRQVRELAIAGARHLADDPKNGAAQRLLLERMARRFAEPDTAGIDRDLLREGKERAWPVR